MDVYINNISNNCKKYLILSWAMPDQPGHATELYPKVKLLKTTIVLKEDMTYKEYNYV
jgi:hypothetical protein